MINKLIDYLLTVPIWKVWAFILIVTAVIWYFIISTIF